ncbi:MAG: hypothetical protein ABSF56_00335 [Minisyncoccia bacterium]|jgi:hypothetical protein
MTKTQALILIIVVILILIGIEIGIHSHNQDQEATTAVGDCVVLCQGVFDSSGRDAAAKQEQSCENVCYKSAGLPAPR